MYSIRTHWLTSFLRSLVKHTWSSWELRMEVASHAIPYALMFYIYANKIRVSVKSFHLERHLAFIIAFRLSLVWNKAAFIPLLGQVWWDFKQNMSLFTFYIVYSIQNLSGWINDAHILTTSLLQLELHHCCYLHSSVIHFNSPQDIDGFIIVSWDGLHLFPHKVYVICEWVNATKTVWGKG